MDAQEDAPSHKRPRNEELPPPAPVPADRIGADRLSDLPEGLLHHVLSLLPAHEAVRTCVLARPWRHLWKSAPGLVVTAIEGFRSADKLDRFVTCLLRLHRSSHGDARLESCEFSFCEMDFDFDGFLPDSEPHLSSWIETALVRKVKVLRVLLAGSDDNFDDYELPYQRLSSHHLTTLELTNVDTNDSVLDFSGCPALLELHMSYCNLNSGHISSQSLKHLSMLCCEFSELTRTRMSLPSLVCLELVENSGRAPLLDSMPELETATVTFEDCCTDKCADRMGQFDACGNRACKGCYYNDEPVDDHHDSLLLKGLSQASELIMATEDDTDVYVFMRDLRWCPTFSNLVTLELREWCFADGLDAISLFLRHSPILEELILRLPLPYEVSKNSGEAAKKYNPVKQSVASGLLQMVKIKCQVVDGMVLRILKMLDASGVPFDKIIIQCGCFNFLCTDFSSE